MTFGLTAAGFVPKRVEDILASLEAAQRDTIAADLDVSQESVTGQLNASFATELASAWEALASAYDARTPSNASHQGLDDLSAITGTLRRLPTAGTVLLKLHLSAGATVPMGSIAAVAGQPSNQWVTVTGVTNGAGIPADLTVLASATTPGRIIANSGTITQIMTPISGWSSVTNDDDAVPGQDLETDVALRQRRELEVQGAGTSPLGALAASLSRVTGVTQAMVFENATDVPLPSGQPGHSFEALVLGGADADLAAAIWAHKPVGIESWGAVTTTTVDASSVTRMVSFSRPTTKAVQVSVHVIPSGAYPGGGAGSVAVQDAIVAYGATLLAGDPVRLSRVVAAALSVPGVIDAWADIGWSTGTLVPANLYPGQRDLATIESADITVVEP